MKKLSRALVLVGVSLPQFSMASGQWAEISKLTDLKAIIEVEKKAGRTPVFSFDFDGVLGGRRETPRVFPELSLPKVELQKLIPLKPTEKRSRAFIEGKMVTTKVGLSGADLEQVEKDNQKTAAENIEIEKKNAAKLILNQEISEKNKGMLAKREELQKEITRLDKIEIHNSLQKTKHLLNYLNEQGIPYFINTAGKANVTREAMAQDGIPCSAKLSSDHTTSTPLFSDTADVGAARAPEILPQKMAAEGDEDYKNEASGVSIMRAGCVFGPADVGRRLKHLVALHALSSLPHQDGVSLIHVDDAAANVVEVLKLKKPHVVSVFFPLVKGSAAVEEYGQEEALKALASHPKMKLKTQPNGACKEKAATSGTAVSCEPLMDQMSGIEEKIPSGK